MDRSIGKQINVVVSYDELAAECGRVSDKVNNLLTAIQIKAGLLLPVRSLRVLISEMVNGWFLYPPHRAQLFLRPPTPAA